MPKKMGYQGLLYYGTKGSTAATQLTKRVDASEEVDQEIGSTTSAGDGTTVPINTGEVTALTGKITFSMIIDSTDPAIPILVASAKTGNPVALRFISFSGSTGLDADCNIKVKLSAPLKGEQTMDIDVTSLSSSLREPLLNA